MVLKPNKPPANYQKLYPFHYAPSAQSIVHYRHRVSQFKNNSTLRCYWMAGQDHFNNCYFNSDQTHIDYKPPTSWPVHAAPLRLPRVVNVIMVFHEKSTEDVGGRGDQWAAIRDQLNSFFNDYVGMFVCEDAGTITDPEGGGSNFRWLQFMCPRREDVVTSNNDKFLGGDQLNIVVYNDLGYGSRAGGDGILLDGTLPTNYFTSFDGYAIDRWPGFGDIETINTNPNVTMLFGGITASPTEITFGQQAYNNDVQALKNAFPAFVRNKTLVYLSSTTPSGHEQVLYLPTVINHIDAGVIDGIRTTVVQDTWASNSPTITYPIGTTEVPTITIGQVQQRISVDGFELTPPPTYLVGIDSGPRQYYWDLQTENVWSDLITWMGTWLQQVCTDLHDYGWEYKGTVETGSGFTVLKQAIIDYFQLTDADKKS